MIFIVMSHGFVEGKLVSGQKSLEGGRNVKTIQVLFLHFNALFFFDRIYSLELCFYII